MPSLKIYPPVKLPDKNVSETQFNMWQEELEVYLSQESNFKNPMTVASPSHEPSMRDTFRIGFDILLSSIPLSWEATGVFRL